MNYDLDINSKVLFQKKKNSKVLKYLSAASQTL